MKNSLLVFIILSGILFSCSNGGSVETSTDNVSDSQVIESIAKVEVYYFHAKHRCPTCIAIEDVAKSTIEKYFSKEFEEKEIAFITINLSEEGNDNLIEKFEITSSSLIIRTIDGDEEKIENLTESGFMNARSNPEKLEKEIKETMDLYLK